MAGTTLPPHLRGVMGGGDKADPPVSGFLTGCLLGVLLTAFVSMFALYGNDLHWKCQAYEHHAAVWTQDAKGHVGWMWLDDYFYGELLKKIPDKKDRL